MDTCARDTEFGFAVLIWVAFLPDCKKFTALELQQDHMLCMRGVLGSALCSHLYICLCTAVPKSTVALALKSTMPLLDAGWCSCYTYDADQQSLHKNS